MSTEWQYDQCRTLAQSLPILVDCNTPRLISLWPIFGVNYQFPNSNIVLFFSNVMWIGAKWVQLTKVTIRHGMKLMYFFHNLPWAISGLNFHSHGNHRFMIKCNFVMVSDGKRVRDMASQFHAYTFYLPMREVFC